MGSLEAEGRARGSRVGVHTLSPGMIVTDLLLSGATVGNKVCAGVLHITRAHTPKPEP